MKCFDYAATTPVDEKILATYCENTRKYYAHSGVNKEVLVLEQEAKNTILSKLNFDVDTYQLIFTSG